MNDWIDRLFSGYLPAETIAAARADYPSFAHVPLRQLGLESLAVMGIVLNMEAEFGIQIDYDTFDVGVLDTLASAKDYLEVTVPR